MRIEREREEGRGREGGENEKKNNCDMNGR